MLARLGFQALATTSMGYAFSRGRHDGAVGRDEMLKHVSEIATATDLPVSADLENGYGDSPEIVSETIKLAASTGIAGCSIEDATGRSEHPIYEKEHATERMRAAVEAARKLPFPFTLTGRAENYLHSRPDLKDTIARLQAYQEAGADVLYAPGLTSSEEIAAVVNSLDRPVNAVMGLRGVLLSLDELSGLGVKRVSLGSSLIRCVPALRLANFLTGVTPGRLLQRRRARPRKRTPEATDGAKPESSGPREGSKTAQVVAMLQREQGATISEIMTTMGWQKHTSAGSWLAR